MDEKICLIDLDGTLFDYEKQLKSDLAALASPNDPNFENLWQAEEKAPWLKARMNLIKGQPGWWKKLPIMKDGEVLLNLAKDIGFSCKILTKGPKSHPQAWGEKVECCLERLPLENVDVTIVGKGKKGIYGRVLIDDYPEYMEQWLSRRPRGLGIMPLRPYNKDFRHPNVILYDNNLFEVEKALKAAFERIEGQHWKDLS